MELITQQREDLIKLFSSSNLDPVVEAIGKKVEELKVDLDPETSKGRAGLISLSSRIARSKTYLDEIGKDVTSVQRKKIAEVDFQRRKIKDAMDSLKKETRRPVTEWENQEKNRVEIISGRVNNIKSFSSINDLADSKQLQTELEKLKSIQIDNSFQEFEKEAVDLKQSAVDALEIKIHTLQQHEADQAELQRLRVQDEKRKREDHEKQLKEDAAREAKEQVEREVKERQDKVEQEKQEAIKKQKEAEENTKRLEQEKIETEKRLEQEKIELAKKVEIEKEEAEKAAIEREKKRADDELKSAAEEKARREANEKHVAKIDHGAAVAIDQAIEDIKLSALVIALIKNGEIPNVSIRY